jgi:hypothetical protein
MTASGRGEFIRLALWLQATPVPRQARWCGFHRAPGICCSLFGVGWIVHWRMDSPLRVKLDGVDLWSVLVRDVGGSGGVAQLQSRPLHETACG